MDVRAGAGAVYRIVNADTGEVIGTADEHRAFAKLHPGAVYLHMGEQFLVTELHLDRGVAAVEAADPDYYTQARKITDIEIVGGLEPAALGDVEISFGDVLVTDQVVGFVRKLVSTNEVVDEEALALPPQRLETRALWYAPGEGDREAAITPRQLAGAIHAAEHAAIGLMPLIATCDRWDLGGVSTPLHPTRASRRSSSTTRIPAVRGSASEGSGTSSGSSTRRSRRSGSARARSVAPPASRARSAATATSRSTSRRPASLLAAVLGVSWG